MRPDSTALIAGLASSSIFSTWRLKAFQLELSTQVTEVDAHCYSARVRGTFPAGGSPAVEYRKAGASTWTVKTVTAKASGKTTYTVKNLDKKGCYESALNSQYVNSD